MLAHLRDVEPDTEDEYPTAWMWMDLQTYGSACVAMTDALAAANNVHVRYPFLAPEVVSCLMAMPARHKMPLGGKVPLKRLAAGIYGSDFAWRPKRGFGPPIEAWCVRQRRHILETVSRCPAVDNVAAATLLADFAHPFWARRVWTLYALARWCGVHG
jgi:asparagine synthetase B (glutamine-hydrolysing)